MRDTTHMQPLQVTYRKVSELIPYANNARRHSDEQITKIASSIREFGFTNPILLDGKSGIIAGHGRLMAAKKLGIEDVPTIDLNGMSEAQKKAYIIADNKLTLDADWDFELLNVEFEALRELDFDIGLTGFDADEVCKQKAENKNTEDDELPELSTQPRATLLDVWALGNHRLMCGDATVQTHVHGLMDGKKANMVLCDPPYGMKKEKNGVLNDNLNYDDLLEFNKEWIPLSFSYMEDNGSWYCFGNDEPLMDIYASIIKPMAKANLATFRNLITWDKGSGQGQNSENTRSYAIADEKILFVMGGVQGFSTNADAYYEGWEPIRKYLEDQRMICGWDIPTMKRIAGHSERSRDHWTSRSQWTMPTREVYEAFKIAARGKYDAFKKEYDEIKKEYDEIKKEYDEIKKEYYATRSYFNNTHDNFNNVLHFSRTVKDGSEGGHATPKPLNLLMHVLKTSCPDGGICLDLFGGSGSTLIACERLGISCHILELSPKWCDVIIQRWENETGKKAELITPKAA